MTELWRYEAIYAVVATIPVGRVATYGQIAGAAGLPGRARLVGKALASLPERSAVPWYRVVGTGGRIRTPRGPDGEERKAGRSGIMGRPLLAFSVWRRKGLSGRIFRRSGSNP